MMQAKKTALYAIICLANLAFAHTPNIEDIANTPCGQHDCHCPEELKLAHEQEQLKQLGIDPAIVKALKFIAKKDKQGQAEQDARLIQKKIYADTTCATLGALALLIQTVCVKQELKLKPIESHMANYLFTLGLSAIILGGFFGIRDCIELSNKKKQLEKING